MAEVPRHQRGDVERRLLTLYTLKKLGPSLNLQLIAFMAETGLMNYFDLQTALYDLTSGGHVTREPIAGDDRYTITPQGAEAIELFRQRLGDSLLSGVDEAAPDFAERMKRDRELYSAISHLGHSEYHAQMGVADGGMKLLHIDLSLPTADLAERFCAAWPDHAREIYDFIVSRLSGEELL